MTLYHQILDCLSYNDKYPYLDQSMSDSNIGGRKEMNIRNYIFNIIGIFNSVIQGEEKCIDIQVYDLKQAFDSLILGECMNDVYDSLPEEEKDDKIALVYQSNIDNMVSVKTVHGLTDRENIPRIVQQGGV